MVGGMSLEAVFDLDFPLAFGVYAVSLAQFAVSTPTAKLGSTIIVAEKTAARGAASQSLLVK